MEKYTSGLPAVEGFLTPIFFRIRPMQAGAGPPVIGKFRLFAVLPRGHRWQVDAHTRVPVRRMSESANENILSPSERQRSNKRDIEQEGERFFFFSRCCRVWRELILLVAEFVLSYVTW